MGLRRGGRAIVLAVAVLATLVGATGTSGAAPPEQYWTPERMDAAAPRDLVIDHRGLGYLRAQDGSLTPYGHDVAAERPRLRALPAAKPSNPGGGGGGGESNDTTAPVISDLDPNGITIGASYAFSAVVTDAGSGVKSVTFVVTYPDGVTTQSFSASGSGDVWSVTLQGFTAGNWRWHVVAKDNAKRGGNTATSAEAAFSVDTGSGGGGGDEGDVVANAEWTSGGTVQTAAGRLYFEMPANPPMTKWNGYVCSGTAVADSTSGRSIILTAAHCVYDDVYKVFARNVLFIPNQAGTTGTGTDLNCNNDPLGCWEPSVGVVDSNWATRQWPSNIPWDYGYYAVADGDRALDVKAGSLTVQFDAPTVGAKTHALGYSYSEDPKLMYCAEAMGTDGSTNWFLPSCLLSGGSSGGPWLQPVNGGDGPIVSVNSYGYSNSAGMGGPKLSGTSASCLFGVAKGTNLANSARGVTAC